MAREFIVAITYSESDESSFNLLALHNDLVKIG